MKPVNDTELDTELDKFLSTLKIHNKDVSACFNDALAVGHIKELISRHYYSPSEVLDIIGSDQERDEKLFGYTIKREQRNRLKGGK